jgi:hypothetical protein
VRLTDEEYQRLEEIEEARQEEAEQTPTARKAATVEFLKTLPPMERDILMLTAEFWDSKKREAVIDPEVREGFCKQYGLTESSLRVKRMRLKERAQIYIEQRTRSVNHN